MYAVPTVMQVMSLPSTVRALRFMRVFPRRAQRASAIGSNTRPIFRDRDKGNELEVHGGKQAQSPSVCLGSKSLDELKWRQYDVFLESIQTNQVCHVLGL